MSKEVWVQHPEFDAYFVSDKGRIYSTYRRGRILQPKVDKDGYLEVVLTKDKQRHYKRVHRLVADCFLENPNNLPVINHIDKNKQNNTPSNLEWCDVYHNTVHSLDIDLNKIKQIPSLYLEGLDYAEINKRLSTNFDSTTIGEILSGKKHSKITGISEDIRCKSRSRISSGCRPDVEVFNILEDYFRNGLTQSEIVKKYNTSPASVSRIVNRKRYIEIYDRYMEEHG